MAKELAWVDWEKCIDLANKRLRDVITAANKADDKEMTALMMSSMCGDESEFLHYNEPDCPVTLCPVTLCLDKLDEGIYFNYLGYEWHVSMDAEFFTDKVSDLFHVWCVCEFFGGEEMPCGEVYVDWSCGASFIKEAYEKYRSYVGSENVLELEQALFEWCRITIESWLENNKEKINAR